MDSKAFAQKVLDTCFARSHDPVTQMGQVVALCKAEGATIRNAAPQLREVSEPEKSDPEPAPASRKSKK